MGPATDIALPRRVVVIGTGLIGTSAALALSERGAEVLLDDRDPEAVRLAVDIGAGKPYEGEAAERADLAVIAVPPSAVAGTLADAQRRGLARAYTDVASVKTRPLAEAASRGCALADFVGGHPLAGRERSGPAAARADLFLGRPWVLCPSPATSGDVVEVATAFVRACGAEPVTLDPAAHDRAVALVSHAPHLVSSAMAALLRSPDDTTLSLAGQGVRDVTRIAAGDVDLWTAIATANADPLADVLEAVAADLVATARALREHRTEAVTTLLRDGRSGQARLPGKHGARTTYTTVTVVVSDRPGQLARLFDAAGNAEVNIEDVSVEHSPGLPVGVVELYVRPEASAALVDRLRDDGWSVRG
ncbi:MAG: prephenate dehydrogenase [Streptosporangiaceae bacterium]